MLHRNRPGELLHEGPHFFPSSVEPGMIGLANSEMIPRIRCSFARAATVTLTCQILPYEIASGPANMALDEALLDHVSARRDVACLRTYGWTVPTLSLGYFQHLGQAGPAAGNRSR